MDDIDMSFVATVYTCIFCMDIVNTNGNYSIDSPICDECRKDIREMIKLKRQL